MSNTPTTPATAKLLYAEEQRAAFWLWVRDSKIAEMLDAHNLSAEEFLEWLREKLT